MTDSLPTLFTPEVLTLFWHYVRMFLIFGMPLIMICVAAFMSQAVVGVILDLFTDKKKFKHLESDYEDDFIDD